LGRGWARGITSTCFDSALGKLKKACQRGPDGHNENYINPEDHFVEVHVVLPPTMTDAQCNWTVGEVRDAETVNKPCDQSLSERFRYGIATPVTVVVLKNGATQAQLNTPVQVRDILIVGMGDSIAAGEGNPDQPIALGAADEGFCFDRPLSNGEYAVPTRERHFLSSYDLSGAGLLVFGAEQYSRCVMGSAQFSVWRCFASYGRGSCCDGRCRPGHGAPSASFATTRFSKALGASVICCQPSAVLRVTLLHR